MIYPRLDEVVKGDDVSEKGRGKFAASYVNWSRIARYLREHAPGWQAFAKPNGSGDMLHEAPDGTYYLLIGFRRTIYTKDGDGQPFVKGDVEETETVPHALMDHTMKAKKNPDARDVSDAFVRGMCKAAAMLFGLGWRLWSKDDPFDRDDDEPERRQAQPAKKVEPDASGFSSPEKAGTVLAACGTDDLGRWWAKVEASAFSDEEKGALIEAAKKRREQLKEGATA